MSHFILKVNPPYEHSTVNHSVEFVNRLGEHTNAIESYWRHMKHRFQHMYGIQHNYLDTYLDEFMWRDRSSFFTLV